MECKVISNDLYAVRIFSRFESRESRKTEFNSSIDNRDRNTEKQDGDEDRTHSFFSSLSISLPLFLYPSISLSLFHYLPISLSLFGVARGKRIIQLVPSIEIGLSSIPLHPNPTRYTLPSLCVSIFHALYTSNLFPLSRKHSALSIRRAD